jgi:hypothetical protein
MEPVSLVIVSAAAGGLVSKLSERIADHLYATFARGHSEETRYRARANTQAFAEEVFRYVDAKLAAGADIPEDRLEDRLTDPDFASTLETATRAASRTSDAERHAILAELVAERLTSQAVTVDTVASTTAIEVLPRLAPLHVEMLGLLAAVQWLRPEWWGDETQATLDEHVRWMADLTAYYDLGITYDRMDLLHLASTGCVLYPTTFPRHVDSLLTNGVPDGYVRWNVGSFFLGTPDGTTLSRLWKLGLCDAELLPVGGKIGWAVYESRSRNRVPAAAGAA